MIVTVPQSTGMPTLTVLGSTGSIGANTLDVIRQNSHQYPVYALAAGRNLDLLADQIREFRPRIAVVPTTQIRDRLAARLEELNIEKSKWPELVFGPKALVAISTASEPDIVVSAIVGVAGLEATYEAVRAGKRVGLANKEVLVSAGRLVMEAVQANGSELIPIDSEHNGAHQCLRAGNRAEVTKLILTASGGPFRSTAVEQLDLVAPEDALKHPTWKMGRRISIDSATLMNKGFEVIEACRLFAVPPEKVKVIVHPQSTIHSMVEFVDGSILAQFSVTDMRLPILYALTYPERIVSSLRFPVMDLRHLDFVPPDMEKFPCLRLAYEAARAGGAKPIALNASDEVAVAAFLDGSIRFEQIPETIEYVLGETENRKPESISEILLTDAEARTAAKKRVQYLSRSNSPLPWTASAIHHGE